MSEFDCGWIEDELCGTCRWFDADSETCDHPTSINFGRDVGENDYCRQWSSAEEVKFE